MARNLSFQSPGSFCRGDSVCLVQVVVLQCRCVSESPGACQMQVPGPHLTWQSAGIHVFNKCCVKQWCACPCWEKFWAQSFRSFPLRNVLGFREPRGAHVVGALMMPRTAQWAAHQDVLHRVSTGSFSERHPGGRGPFPFSEGSVPTGCWSALLVQPLPWPGPGRGTTCSREVQWGRWARSSGSERCPLLREASPDHSQLWLTGWCVRCLWNPSAERPGAGSSAHCCLLAQSTRAGT